MADQYVQYPNITVASGTASVVKIEATNGDPLTATGTSLNANITGGTVTATNPSVGANNVAEPTSSTLVGGQNGGNLKPINISAGGAVLTDSSAVTQPVSAASLPLPTGASTSALQTTGNSSLSSIDGKLNSLGQKTMAASAPVVIASDQSAVPVSGTVTSNQGGAPWTQTIIQGGNTATVSAGGALKVDASASTQPVSGTVTVTQATGTNLHTVVDSGSITATQATGSNLHTVVDSGTLIVTQATGTNLHTVVDSGTITANIGTSGSLALDATLAKLTITQGTALGANTQALSGASVTTSAPTYTTGQISPLSLNTSGGLRVDGSGVTQPVSIAGRSKVNLIRNDYTSTSVTTAAYVQLVASTAATINLLDVFDSSGQTLKFAVGAAASEVDQFYIYPGGNGRIELSIPSGSRLSVKAVSATASVGELDINTFS